MRKDVYKVPVFTREMLISPDGRYQKCTELDGLGFFVKYDDESQLKPGNIRKYLHGRRQEPLYVVAENLIEALRNFFRYPATKIGSNLKPENKAMWLAPGKPIEVLPRCRLLHRIPGAGQFVCGKMGEYGGCVLEGFDTPDGYCPIGNPVPQKKKEIWVWYNGNFYRFLVDDPN